jgi:hypothetical protein
MTTDKKVETTEYEAPKLVILGPAEDLTRIKNGIGADASSAFHQST